jgi:hypothetical protein
MIQLSQEMFTTIGTQVPYMEGNAKISLFSNELNQNAVKASIIISKKMGNSSVQLKGSVHQKIFPGYHMYDTCSFLVFKKF